MYEFKRPLATSRAPKILLLGMLRLFVIIEPKLDQIRAWLHRGHRWAVEVHGPLKSLVKGYSLLLSLKQVSQENQYDPPPLKYTVTKECLMKYKQKLRLKSYRGYIFKKFLSLRTRIYQQIWSLKFNFVVKLRQI